MGLFKFAAFCSHVLMWTLQDWNFLPDIVICKICDILTGIWVFVLIFPLGFGCLWHCCARNICDRLLTDICVSVTYDGDLDIYDIVMECVVVTHKFL